MMFELGTKKRTRNHHKEYSFKAGARFWRSVLEMYCMYMDTFMKTFSLLYCIKSFNFD